MTSGVLFVYLLQALSDLSSVSEMYWSVDTLVLSREPTPNDSQTRVAVAALVRF